MLSDISDFLLQVKPPSIDFHIPPETPPARIISGFLASSATARVLPPISLGPTSFQSNGSLIDLRLKFKDSTN